MIRQVRYVYICPGFGSMSLHPSSGKFLAPAVNFLCQAGNGKYIDIFVTVCFPEHVFTKKEILLIIYVQIASKHQRMHLFFLTMDIVICAVVGSEPVDDLPRVFSPAISESPVKISLSKIKIG